MIVLCPHESLAAICRERRPSHAVVLAAPGQPVPVLPPGIATLHLAFHDIASERPGLVAPDAAAIEALLAFGAGWSGETPLVVSCQMAVSRSPAAAFLVLCAGWPDIAETEHARALRRAAPVATPNPLMVALADARLGRGGRMATAVAAIGRGEEYRPFRAVDVPVTPRTTPSSRGAGEGSAAARPDPLPLVTTLVLGGARSGKSGHAERIVRASGLSRIYVATAEALDGEMRERIAHHRARREDWTTIEEPLDLVGTLRRESAPGRAILVDCLTLWLSNLLFAERDLETEGRALCAALPALAGPVVLVSNEVGMGLVPETPLGRRFRDAQGRLNQAVAAAVPSCVFVAAGLPLILKGDPM